MTVKELKQYRSLKCEIKEIEDKIEGGKMRDVVKASDKEFPYVSHSVKIEGADFNDNRMKMYIAERDRLRAQIIHIESWINNIPDSELRRIFRYRYIDGRYPCSWKGVANRLGVASDGSTERKKHDRYLLKWN